MPATGTALELGCGNGVSTVALCDKGRYTTVYGVDISEVAIQRAVALGHLGIHFVVADVFNPVHTAVWSGQCTAVFDCQFFHAVRAVAAPDDVAKAMADLLAPHGGRLFVLAGNASEPPRVAPGPSLLTRDEVVGPFERAGLVLVSLETTRFDSTPAYGEVPPLAWAAVFAKP